MAAIISVAAVVLVSTLINRFATIALSLTGMSRAEARVQARAAMSGVGLTTRTPDDIVAHPSGDESCSHAARERRDRMRADDWVAGRSLHGPPLIETQRSTQAPRPRGPRFTRFSQLEQ